MTFSCPWTCTARRTAWARSGGCGRKETRLNILFSSQVGERRRQLTRSRTQARWIWRTDERACRRTGQLRCANLVWEVRGRGKLPSIHINPTSKRNELLKREKTGQRSPLVHEPVVPFLLLLVNHELRSLIQKPHNFYVRKLMRSCRADLPSGLRNDTLRNSVCARRSRSGII